MRACNKKQAFSLLSRVPSVLNKLKSWFWASVRRTVSSAWLSSWTSSYTTRAGLWASCWASGSSTCLPRLPCPCTSSSSERLQRAAAPGVFRVHWDLHRTCWYRKSSTPGLSPRVVWEWRNSLWLAYLLNNRLFRVLIIETVVRIVNNLKDLNGFKIGAFHIDFLPLWSVSPSSQVDFCKMNKRLNNYNNKTSKISKFRWDDWGNHCPDTAFLASRVVVLFANAVLTLHKYFKFAKSLRIGIAWALT